jgi:DNA-binding HxlR family transcriptional regulator
MSCSIARTIDLIGEWWTPLILRDLFLGHSRFEDIRRNLGIASNVLSVRLERLLEHDIVTRRQYLDAPPRFEYLLTEKGRDLYPIMATLTAFGDRWLAGDDGPPARFTHDCGHPAQAVVACAHCGGELTADRVRPLSGSIGQDAENAEDAAVLMFNR